MLHLFKLKQNPANIFAIWFICNQENLGDTNMFKGINNAFEQTAKEQNLVINTLLINPGEATFYVANVQPPQIIFAIGDLGARAIKNIIDSSGDKLHTTKFVWAGHMGNRAAPRFETERRTTNRARARVRFCSASGSRARRGLSRRAPGPREAARRRSGACRCWSSPPTCGARTSA